jgi:hypothetical protein
VLRGSKVVASARRYSLFNAALLAIIPVNAELLSLRRQAQVNRTDELHTRAAALHEKRSAFSEAMQDWGYCRVPTKTRCRAAICPERER